MSEAVSHNANKDRKQKISRIAKAAAGVAFLGMSLGVPVQLVRDGVTGAIFAPNPVAQSHSPAVEADNPLTWVATPIADVAESFDSYRFNQPQSSHDNLPSVSLPPQPSLNEPSHQSAPPNGELVTPESRIKP